MEMPAAAMSSSNSKLMKLPQDILLNILFRLPARSLLQFRYVSKSLRNLVDDPAVAAMHIAATNDHADVEVRVLPNGSAYCLQFVSCGLLGLKCPEGTLGLYNPLRVESLWLPKPEIHYGANYGMGFDYVTSTYKILLFYINEYYPSNSKASVHVLGTSSWRRIHSVPPCEVISPSGKYAYGNTYWLTYDNNNSKATLKNRMMHFDFEKEEFGWTTIPSHFKNSAGESRVFLINLKGSLALVDVFAEKKIEIWVHKEKKHWSKDYSMTLRCTYSYPDISVGAWEHGIYISSMPLKSVSDKSTVLYCDLRCDSKRGEPNKCLEHETQKNVFIISYTGSLIYLKYYENLRRQNKSKNLKRKRKDKKNYFDAGKSESPKCFSGLEARRIK
ncbi:F-box protein At2g07140-like [Argentina anserina]|uniref:F-box protein At2g07140-like n=1 Tax=Argentina anserina TaxID=57926 RepID=UPI0021765ABD|nr:F-box protein At2g07140-like [Potentilla anserina]